MEQGKIIGPKFLKTTQGSREWQDADGRVICTLLTRSRGVIMASFPLIICIIHMKFCFKQVNDLQRF